MPARSNHLMQIAIDCYSYLPSQSLQVLSNPSIEKDAGGQKGCLHRWISVPIMTWKSLCTMTFLPLKSGLTLWKLGLHVYHFSHFSGCHTGKWPTLWFSHGFPMVFPWFSHGTMPRWSTSPSITRGVWRRSPGSQSYTRAPISCPCFRSCEVQNYYILLSYR